MAYGWCLVSPQILRKYRKNFEIDQEIAKKGKTFIKSRKWEYSCILGVRVPSDMTILMRQEKPYFKPAASPFEKLSPFFRISG